MALKILKSDKSTKDNTELAMLQSFQQSSIVNCLSNFWIQSPNGPHLCIVMEVTGPSVAQYVESLWYGVLDAHTAVDLSRQCVTALKTLHDLGYAHGGQSRSIPCANIKKNPVNRALTVLRGNRCLLGELRAWPI